VGNGEELIGLISGGDSTKLIGIPQRVADGVNRGQTLFVRQRIVRVVKKIAIE
jgi:hypothetical protein